MNKIVWFLICLLSTFSFTSCTLLRQTAGNRHSIGLQALKVIQTDTLKNSTTAKFIGPVNEPEQERLKALKEQEEKRQLEKQKLAQNLSALFHSTVQFKTFTGKAKMRYQEKDNEKEFTAHIRMIKDSAIWVSVTALGGMVQVAKILVTKDSLKMINYIDKEAELISLDQASRLLPVPANYNVLQNFILGQNLINKGEINNASDTAGNWVVQVDGIEYLQQVAYQKTDSTMLYSAMRTQDPAGPQGIIQFHNYTITPNCKFALNRLVQIQNAGLTYLLDMDFANADFDISIDLPFNLPKNYTVNPRK